MHSILNMEILKKYVHSPAHAFVPDMHYFVTASIYNSRRLLKESQSKSKLLEYMVKTLNHNNWVLEDWVILENHYHIMVKCRDNPEKLSKIFENIHKYSANWISKNVRESDEAIKIWHNYWDTCISYEHSYFARLNYIWMNPVKHGYVKHPEEWKFGSYFERFKKDREYLRTVSTQYPCNKVKVKDDF